MYEGRKLAEILRAGKLFAPFDYDEAALHWIHLYRLRLPPGRWNKRSTELLVLIPSAYPEVAPQRFYLDSDLRDRCGRPPGHYFLANEFTAGGWAWLCLHFEEGWRPRRNIEEGGNLATIIERIQIGLCAELSRRP